MRRFRSTMYASLIIPDDKRSAMCRNMGHSKTINETIYQAPTAKSKYGTPSRLLIGLTGRTRRAGAKERNSTTKLCNCPETGVFSTLKRLVRCFTNLNRRRQEEVLNQTVEGGSVVAFGSTAAREWGKPTSPGGSEKKDT